MNRRAVLFLAVTIFAFARGLTGQVSIEEAQHRLAEKAAHSGATSGPTSRATTKPIAGKKPDNKIIFVVSTAGSMLAEMGDVRVALKDAIYPLKPDQMISVITSADGKADGPLKGKLTPATDEAKQKIESYLNNIVAGGGSDLMPGIKQALNQQPDVVWIVSNGYAPGDRGKFLHAVHLLNADRHVRINTVLNFVPVDITGQQNLFDLAQGNGGICLDQKGNRVTERPQPPKPVGVPKPKPPATKPSIFQDQ